ncbi:PH domain-containing protein [Shewanella phaeophyticola]|uniref:PH domain-containing protein n=1 Tax=Shewanella phaeophyticola TaxID=2978345 RepID=A0ABT2P5W1_9GAMM|nr:PH domain-containing protein [Shewanella sp. KJ10-1]MCT8988052.1 PH domain-containing protein [Shewanella sp. KJ10-1]
MNVIELAPLDSGAIYSFIALLLGLLGLTVFIFFKPIPSNAKYLTLGIMLPLMGLFVFTFYQSFNSTMSWDDKQLQVNIPLYSNTIEINQVDFAQARVVNRLKEPEYAAKWRTNGLGMPGYSLGWFSLNNGVKALLSVTKPAQVIMLPISQNKVIMVSVIDADKALAKLHASASASKAY